MKIRKTVLSYSAFFKCGFTKQIVRVIYFQTSVSSTILFFLSRGVACFFPPFLPSLSFSLSLRLCLALGVIGVTLSATAVFYLKIYVHIAAAAEAVSGNTNNGNLQQQQRAVYFQVE